MCHQYGIPLSSLRLHFKRKPVVRIVAKCRLFSQDREREKQVKDNHSEEAMASDYLTVPLLMENSLGTRREETMNSATEI